MSAFQNNFLFTDKDSSLSLHFLITNQPIRLGNMFDFIEEKRNGCLLLCPKGNLNHSTVGLIRDRLYNHCCEDGCRIVMCMKDVDFIDSAGLGVMVHAHKYCDKYGGMIVYSDMNDMIIKNMKMLTMDRYLNFSPNIDSALMKFDW